MADPGGAASLRVLRRADGAVICSQLSLGKSFAERFLGLMGRRAIGDEEGLYLQTSSIHMMFMRFPIDALFLGEPDEDGGRQVVAAREQLPPWRGIVMPVRGAEGVIELPAGTLGRLSVGPADVVTFEPNRDGVDDEVRGT